MKQHSKKLLAALLLLFPLMPLTAQVLECGTDFTDQQLDSLEMDMGSDPDYASKTYRLLLKHHVYVNNNNIQATKDAFNNMLPVYINKANEIYNRGNIEFISCPEIDYIYGNWNFLDEGRVKDLSKSHNENGAIDIYWAASVQSKKWWQQQGEEVSGFAEYNKAQVAISIYKSHPTTLSHELGHHFSLVHTFGNGNGGTGTEELVRRDHPLSTIGNCRLYGDRICDTPADPNIWNGCLFGGAGDNAKDAYGDYYNPDPSNIMSYVPTKNCKKALSDGQLDRVKKFLSGNNNTAKDELSRRVLTLTNDISNRADIYSAPYIVASNKIAGTPLVEYRGVMKITLLPGFSAASGSNFKANLVPFCEGFDARIHNPSQDDINESEVEKISTLEVSPNPFSSILNVSFSLNESTYTKLSVQNVYGQEVLNLEEAMHEKGNHRKQLDVSSLPPGIYFLDLKDNSSLKTVKLVKTY